MREKFSKLINVYKKYGFLGFCKKLRAYVVANYLNRLSLHTWLRRRHYASVLHDIIDGDYERIILWRSSFGYHVPLFQRPQHIAAQLAKSGCLVLYEVTTVTDRVRAVEKETDNLFLVNYNNIVLNRLLMQALAKSPLSKYIQLYSTDWKLSRRQIEDYMAAGFGFIYEYIDELSPKLSGTSNLPKNITEKYDFVMENKEVFVVVTADLLRDDVMSRRGVHRLCYSANGVDFDFFQSFDESYVLEPEFCEILNLGKPVLCYYGALATWFDYELLRRLAETDKYSIVLFGIKYDGSYDENANNLPNVFFMGPRNYKVLKNYARCADVLMIPFLINDITRATSPVKLFEYMALGKPIVTTDMNECRKFESVLIGHDHDEFLRKIEEALALRNDGDYLALLRREARENDWREKAAAITAMLKANE